MSFTSSDFFNTDTSFTLTTSSSPFSGSGDTTSPTFLDSITVTTTSAPVASQETVTATVGVSGSASNTRGSPQETWTPDALPTTKSSNMDTALIVVTVIVSLIILGAAAYLIRYLVLRDKKREALLKQRAMQMREQKKKQAEEEEYRQPTGASKGRIIQWLQRQPSRYSFQSSRRHSKERDSEEGTSILHAGDERGHHQRLSTMSEVSTVVLPPPRYMPHPSN